MSERERYVLRDETFGGTLYDRHLLRHTFVSQEEMGKELTIDGQKVKAVERWSADTKGIPEDLLFSPTRIYYEVTRQCNLRCTHCFNASGKPMHGEMSTEEVFNTLEGFRGDNIFDIRFTGGELTARPDWFSILRKAKDLGFTVSMNTNGVYRDQKTIDQIADLDLDQVTVSIDGVKEHHEQIRGHGTFDKSIHSLQQLKERGVRLRTNTVITTLSLPDAHEIVAAVEPYVEEVAFFHMRLTGRAQKNLDKAVTFEQLAEFNEGMEQVRQAFPHIRMYFGEMAMRVNSTIMNNFGLKVGGPDGFTRFNILADGSLWAGGYVPYIDPSLRLGNIKDEGYSVQNIWRNSPILNEFRNWSEELVNRCLPCPEFENRCPGVNTEMELTRKNFPQIGNPYCIY
ncbi:MAG: radical SAM protein [Patescibacteria group bacterium]